MESIKPFLLWSESFLELSHQRFLQRPIDLTTTIYWFVKSYLYIIFVLKNNHIQIEWQTNKQIRKPETPCTWSKQKEEFGVPMSSFSKSSAVSGPCFSKRALSCYQLPKNVFKKLIDQKS